MVVKTNFSLENIKCIEASPVQKGTYIGRVDGRSNRGGSDYNMSMRSS